MIIMYQLLYVFASSCLRFVLHGMKVDELILVSTMLIKGNNCRRLITVANKNVTMMSKQHWSSVESMHAKQELIGPN